MGPIMADFQLREPQLGSAFEHRSARLLDERLHLNPESTIPPVTAPLRMPNFQPQFNPLAPNPLDHYAEPSTPRRPGPELDEDGIGTTLGDWRLRFMPQIPGFNQE
jgi:hypothetical protein